MKRMILFFVLLSVMMNHQKVASQSTSSNDLHQLIQINDSQNNIKEFFGKYLTNENNEYLYSIFLPPMNCSRCEGVINPFIAYLKRIDSTSKVYLLVFYHKEKAVKKYLEQRNYLADIILVLNNQDFLDNFLISSGNMQVPFLLKFNIKTGDLVYSKSTLGMNMSSDIVQEIYSAKDPLVKTNCDLLENKNEHTSLIIDQKNHLQSLPVLKAGKKIILQEEEDHPISTIHFLSFDDSGKYFSFMDFLSYQIYLYEINDTAAIFKHAIEPGLTEDKLFVSEDVSDTLFLFLKFSNILNSMYFSSSIQNDTIIIAASLPKVFFEDDEKENLAYYNQITYVLEAINNMDNSNYIVPEPLPDSNLFTSDHTRTLFTRELMFIPVNKGWPGTGTEMLDPDDSDNNPFVAGFYEFTPLIAVYKRNGQFIRYVGTLDADFKRSMVGYHYTYIQVENTEKYFYMTNGYSGKVYQLNKQTYAITDTFRIFNMDDSLSPFDYLTEPLKYILDYQYIYDKVILDFEILNDTIYCLIKEGDYYLCVAKTMDGRELGKDYIPGEVNDMQFVSGKLIRSKDSISLMSIYESGKQTAIFEYLL